MPSFDYQALDVTGNVHRGELTADSPFAARRQLREKGLTPISVKEIPNAVQFASAGAWWRRGLWQSRLPLKEAVLLTRQLSTLLEGGLPLAQVLSILMAQAQSRRLARLLTHLHGRVQEGLSLAAALRSAPYRLDEEVVAMIAAGEESGNLTPVLLRLADALEVKEQLGTQLKGALFYPLLMLLLSLMIVVFLLVVVVPKVVGMFAHMKQTLPPLTQGLMATSNFLAEYWLLLLMALLGAALLARWWLAREGIRRRWHQLLLHLPLAGQLLREGACARWARTLSVLLASGVPAVEALRISAEVMGWLPLRQAVLTMADQVREGVSLHRALMAQTVFPPLLRYLVESGEASGQLAAMLGRAARHYEQHVQALSGSLLRLVEPVLILVMGGVVLLIVLAILLPIFAMNQLVR